MKKISPVIVLALCSPIAMAVACISGGKVETDEVEETVTSELPLSPACGDCAQQALGTTCSTELEACAATPDCLDVSACMDNCQPNDVGCFAQCAQASVLFGELIDCVLCTECAGDCANDWTCEGDPNDPPDPTNDCATCILQDSTDECGQLGQECLASDECVLAAQCVADCGLTDDCVQQCVVNTSEEHAMLLLGLVECATTSPCAQVCGGGTQDPDPPPPDDCNACVQDAAYGTCSDLTEQCLQLEGCNQAIECLQQCGDLSCSDQCLANIDDESYVAAQQLLQCAVCDACGQACGTENQCP